MGQADDIRQYVLEHHIEPARSEGRTELTVRAGDIHNQMSLHQAMPSVCSALGKRKFFDLAAVSLRDRRGPLNGSNVYFTYDLSSDPSLGATKPKSRIRTQRPATMRAVNIDFSDSLVLVSCVKSKLSRKAPARDLYTSALFSGIRNIVDLQDLDWYVLSALHGLVDPRKTIEPYERSLNNMRISDRRNWASGVLETLLPVAKKYSKVVFFAGARYREFLIEPLRRLGIEVVVPMEGLPLGKQLSWLNQFGSSPPSSSQTTSYRLADVKRLYELFDLLSDRVGGPRLLGDIGNYNDWPGRGVYYFFEPSEIRRESGEAPRIVRVGTHGLKSGAKSTLVGRLSHHRGSDSGGSHRGSVFRALVGQALLERGELPECQSWDVAAAKSKASQKLGISVEIIKKIEAPIEKAVSDRMRILPFLWVDVDDSPGPDSARGYLERNSIALLSNFGKSPIDAPSGNWLGNLSDRARVRKAGLWNNNHVEESYDPQFLEDLKRCIDRTG